MSSFIRTIQRDRKPGRSAKLGRGSKLGTKNPKDPCVNRAFKKTRGVRKVKLPLPADVCTQPLPPRLSKAERKMQHASRMLQRRRDQVARDCQFVTAADARAAASINRRTGKPHEHRREIARRTARGL